MKYIVLFKGLNVGGKNIVKMNELKQLLLDLGLQKVKTYIQSGNAVFESNLDEAVLQVAIQTGFTERYGFISDVMIRTIDELRVIVEQLPFTSTEIRTAEIADPQVEHLYVYFLNSAPEQTKIDFISKEYVGTDTLRKGKREVYFLCHQSIRKSKLAIRMITTLDSATVRNWKTVNKLYEILKEL